MKIFFSRLAVLTMLVALSGCSVFGNWLAVEALQEASDSRIAYGSSCLHMSTTCSASRYREWPTSDGRTGCSCDN